MQKDLIYKIARIISVNSGKFGDRDYKIAAALQKKNNLKQVLNYLIANGFNPVSRASQFGGYTFLCDNWAEDFKTLD